MTLIYKETGQTGYDIVCPVPTAGFLAICLDSQSLLMQALYRVFHRFASFHHMPIRVIEVHYPLRLRLFTDCMDKFHSCVFNALFDLVQIIRLKA